MPKGKKLARRQRRPKRPRRPRPKCRLAELPLEILLHIASFLDVKSYQSLFLTNKWFYDTLTKEFLTLFRKKLKIDRMVMWRGFFEATITVDGKCVVPPKICLPYLFQYEQEHKITVAILNRSPSCFYPNMRISECVILISGILLVILLPGSLFCRKKFLTRWPLRKPEPPERKCTLEDLEREANSKWYRGRYGFKTKN